jgi:hypothetical protein
MQYVHLPSTLVLDKSISADAKILYGILILKSKKTGYCFATNSFFASMFGVKERSIQRYLKQLSQNKYVHVVMGEDNQNRRIFICAKSAEFDALTNNETLKEGDKIVDNNNTSKEDIALGTNVPKAAEVKKVAAKKIQPVKKKEPDHNWQRWIDRWDVFFPPRNDGRKPLYNGGQFKALKGIRAYLLQNAKPRKGDASDKSPEDCAFTAWEYLLDHWDWLDDFQMKQFDLTFILKKLPEFLNQLKNGRTHTNGRTNSGSNGQPGLSQRKIDAAKN